MKGTECINHIMPSLTEIASQSLEGIRATASRPPVHRLTAEMHRVAEERHSALVHLS